MAINGWKKMQNLEIHFETATKITTTLAAISTAAAAATTTTTAATTTTATTKIAFRFFFFFLPTNENSRTKFNEPGRHTVKKKIEN